MEVKIDKKTEHLGPTPPQYKNAAFEIMTHTSVTFSFVLTSIDNSKTFGKPTSRMPLTRQEYSADIIEHLKSALDGGVHLALEAVKDQLYTSSPAHDCGNLSRCTFNMDERVQIMSEYGGSGGECNSGVGYTLVSRNTSSSLQNKGTKLGDDIIDVKKRVIDSK